MGKSIGREDRNFNFLQEIVKKIWKTFVLTQQKVSAAFPALQLKYAEDIFFISSQELEDLYPNLKPNERENEITKKHGAVCITQIGKKLKSGGIHDGRAPDYDDWELNADIFLWFEVLQQAFEISSMGIRVDAESLKKQLIESGQTAREKLPFHQGILTDKLPLSIGGGIGQSRICMAILEKAHIGEVQVSIWPDELIQKCQENGIFLL